MNGGRGIKRRGCLVASFLALMMVLAIGSPARAQTLDPLSTDISNCPTPAATPACATLAYSQCLWLNKPSLCAEVGAGDLVVWEGDLVTEADLAAVPRAYVGRIEARFPEILKMVEGPTVVGRLGADGMPLLGLDDYPDKTSHRILAVRRVDASAFIPTARFLKNRSRPASSAPTKCFWGRILSNPCSSAWRARAGLLPPSQWSAWTASAWI